MSDDERVQGRITGGLEFLRYNAGNFLGYRESNDFWRKVMLLGVSEAAECYCGCVLKMVTEGL